MTEVLRGRTAVITGGGSGIGRVIALAMAGEDASVVVADVADEQARQVADEIIGGGGSAIGVRTDVSSFESSSAMVDAAVGRFGSIDILVNNAGISSPAPVQELAEKDWDRVIAVNLKGTFNCIWHAAPHMIERKWGRIINTSSGARRGSVGSSAYSASKAGIIGLNGSAARDLKPFGITVNAYLPTASRTGLSANRDQKTLEWLKLAHERGQFTQAQYEALVNPPATEKIPPLLLYLCTEDASRITGEVFEVFGDTISVYAESAVRQSISRPDGWTIEELKAAVPRSLFRV